MLFGFPRSGTRSKISSDVAPRARALRVALRLALLAAVLGLAWATSFGTRWPSIYYMTGPSMEPAVRAGEYFWVVSPPGRLRRGDLVIFRYEDEDGVFHVLRRLAGLPADTVSMEEGRVAINGRASGWPYRILAPRARHSPLALVPDLYSWGPWVVPPDSVLLLSDTRDVVGWPDSRFLGFIPRDRIIGRAVASLRGRRLRD
jgi:signal peptidase I